MLRCLLPLIACLGVCWGAEETMVGTAGYEFLTADVDTHSVTQWSRTGQPVWVYDQVRAIDAWRLDNGDTWIAYLPSPATADKGGVRRVGRDGQTKADYAVADEVMSCQPLADGHLLVAECGAGRITELDADGRLLRSFDLVNKGQGHRTVRQIRLTPQGTLLVAECYSGLLREYNRDGKALAQWTLPMAFCARRLANGNVLIAGYQPAHVVEVDPTGKTVWELTAADLPPDLALAMFGEAVRLPNGNTLVACCSRGVTGPRAAAFEVTPDKHVVWQLREPGRVREVTAIKPLLAQP